MTSGSSVPQDRVEVLNDAPVRDAGQYVLVWMTAARRTRWSWMLQHARERCRALGLPLLVFEGLRIDYPWACPRFHRFVVDGMADNKRDFERLKVAYYPYVEPAPKAGRGLVEALAAQAALVITDYKPGFFQARMQEVLAKRLACAMERVDDNGLLPLQCSERAWPTAYALRRYLQKQLPVHLGRKPDSDPLANHGLPALSNLPEAVLSRWPMASEERLAGDLTGLPLQGPGVVEQSPGGSTVASRQWTAFLHSRLSRYPQDRNQAEARGTSGLSAALHFGHISSTQMVHELLAVEQWTPERLGVPKGSRSGWWGLSEGAEAFLDQTVTWREVGHIFCHHVPDFHLYERLPAWAIQTLEEHASDPRPHVYDLEQLARAETHDEIWNAAQRELSESGHMHNYLRMLWGKRILEWSPSPREALSAMIELNNRYALDGRDPNSYSGITWVMGRFDRAWGPERPIFGKIRYMSSANTMRKLKLKGYLQRWGPNRASRHAASGLTGQPLDLFAAR